ncbi:hypothetical protein FHW88_005220 [Mucilaginibacter sp. SG538B]|uniref:hypothetical protein n=1 Tax=Mucilaginibacter sp. SG538B TaxID=2587021 RepID=UPI00159DC210|nr:hypothetical protein [Mucilaginibacter sp. SG538B]NVM66902.1 hypothetical protein [Mucilaginibacter sp. SG538B]
MLKNELETLANCLAPERGGKGIARTKLRPDFNKILSESCMRARESWASAAFSNEANDVIYRYFDFHFKFLCGLISENSGSEDDAATRELCHLLDHLLLYYKGYINYQQLIPSEYMRHRLRNCQVMYQQFMKQLYKLNSDIDLRVCLEESLSKIYCYVPAEPVDLNSLFYREALLTELAGKRNCAELMSSESLISTLISLNFNHFLFLAYLRKKVILKLEQIPAVDYDKHIADLMAATPVMPDRGQLKFDTNWPHVANMYRDCLNDFQVMFALTRVKRNQEPVPAKIPLSISVKHLACMIRVLYETGYYGNISLTAIFDHAAAVFTTKRQQFISPDSLSNAYYEISQAAAIKMSRMFAAAIEFLKPYCFPA